MYINPEQDWKMLYRLIQVDPVIKLYGRKSVKKV